MSKNDEWLNVPGGFIGTANRGYGQHAVEELRRLFPEMKFVYLTPAEVFRFVVPVARHEAIEQIRYSAPVFLRHLQPVDEVLPRVDEVVDLNKLRHALIEYGEFEQGDKVAIQARKTEQSGAIYSPSDVKCLLDEVLTDTYGTVPVVRDADHIVSVFVTNAAMFIGVSKPEDNLSDWAGGMVRFRQEDGQVSRAKFKLLEAEREFGLDFGSYRSAIDLGAAPGGWTSLLLERGLRVTAIDPGDLHPSVKRHPNLTYMKRNAADVKLTPAAFDLLVCDMSWSPMQTGRLLKQLLPALQTGGTVIMTVKLMHKKPFQTIRDLSRELGPELALQRAKQLFHNREELTLFLIKTA